MPPIFSRAIRTSSVYETIFSSNCSFCNPSSAHVFWMYLANSFKTKIEGINESYNIPFFLTQTPEYANIFFRFNIKLVHQKCSPQVKFQFCILEPTQYEQLWHHYFEIMQPILSIHNSANLDQYAPAILFIIPY